MDKAKSLSDHNASRLKMASLSVKKSIVIYEKRRRKLSRKGKILLADIKLMALKMNPGPCSRLKIGVTTWPRVQPRGVTFG